MRSSGEQSPRFRLSALRFVVLAGAIALLGLAIGNSPLAVAARAPTTTVITNTGSPGLADHTVVGETYEVHWSVTSTTPGTITGTVYVFGDGSCSASVETGFCTLQSKRAGTFAISATYFGDANYDISGSAQASHTIDKADVTINITSDLPDPSFADLTFTVTWTATVNSPSNAPLGGSVAIMVADLLHTKTATACSAPASAGQCQAKTSIGGIDTLVAQFKGTASFNPANSGPVLHTVIVRTKTKTSITGEDLGTATGVGDPVKVQFQVKNAEDSKGDTPGGTVSVFQAKGNTDGTDKFLCFDSLDGDGKGECSFTPAAAGRLSLIAKYAGNSDFQPSSGTARHSVVQ